MAINDENSAFAVQSQANKKVYYTRNGAFSTRFINGVLHLTAENGDFVLDNMRTPIVLNAQENVSFSSSGQVLQNGQPVADLGFFTLQDGMKENSPGRFLSDPTLPVPAASTRDVTPGVLEENNFTYSECVLRFLNLLQSFRQIAHAMGTSGTANPVDLLPTVS